MMTSGKRNDPQQYLWRALRDRLHALTNNIDRRRETVAESGHVNPPLAAEVARGTGRLLAERTEIRAMLRRLEINQWERVTG